MDDSNFLCVNCFSPYEPGEDRNSVCPHCGYNNRIPRPQGALPAMVKLHDRYLIGRVTYVNSEGITYNSYDTATDKRVDVREFFPFRLSYREKNKIYPNDGLEELYRRYSREFAEMARGIAKLSTSGGIVPLLDAFKDNNTSYLVYRHYTGVSLSSYVKKKGPLPWEKAKELFIPLMPSLSSMYRFGVKHLGVSPETLRICDDGRLRLTGFSIPSVRVAVSKLKPDLVPGCAAFEQYSQIYDCGETTDVYGYAASLFFALTGSLPENAIDRNKNPRLLIPRGISSSLPRNVLRALSNALQVRQETRTGSFERFRTELTSSTRILSDTSETEAITRLPGTRQYTPQKRRGLPVRLWLILSFFIALGVLGGSSYYVVTHTDYFDKAYNQTLDLVEGSDSTAAETVSVPDMVGDKYSDWLSLVSQDDSYQFSITVSEELFSSDVSAGCIISQNPSGGGRVEKGGTVYLVVSRGPTTQTLPSIKGKKFSKIKSTLEELGLTPVEVNEPSSTIKSGVVLGYSDYEEGDTVEYGSTIRVRVSSGSDSSDG